MDLLRKYMWLWVIAGMLFVCLVISLIFLLINKCISRGGENFSLIVSLFRSNNYQERAFKAVTPPLPPRTQFLTAEAQSYENLAEEPSYEQCTPEYEQSIPDYVQGIPDYEQSTPDYEQSTPDYVQGIPDYEQSTPDYEQSTPDYEQSTPDYVKVDEENILPPPPPYQDPDPAADNISTEDYDDIGGEDEAQGDEDYDDVG
ncbi:uncharacterized protein [Chaetodon trifascialis]|uniref:uncharacterized protein n=1 Tax=Chaetodon trifascialis TaxID=109706 RepID=UPI0039935E78